MDVHSDEFSRLSPEDQQEEIHDQVRALLDRLPPPPPAPENISDTNLLRLYDHFGRLRDRVRFFTRGAEWVAGQVDLHTSSYVACAADDLLEWFDEFADHLDTARGGGRVPYEGGEVEE